MLGHRSRKAWMSGVLLCAAALGSLDTARAQSVTISTGGQPLSGPLTFTVAAGAFSSAQTLSVSTPPNNGNTAVATVPPQYASWLIVNPGVIPSTPGQISVSINAAQLGVGTFAASFSVAVQNNPATAQTVNVLATVTGTSALSSNPASLSFTAQSGQNFGSSNCAVQNSPTSCQVTILSSAGPLTYNILPTPANSWLLVDRASGTTNGSPMNVSVNAGSLSPGTYTGQIQVQSTTTSDAVTVAVTLTVTPNAMLTAAPTALVFYYTIGNPAPASQQVTVSSSGAAIAFNVTQSAGSSWLHVTPITSSASSTNPAALTVSVTPTSPVSLTPGSYPATLSIDGASVTVTLIVSVNPFLSVTSAQLAFHAQFGGAAPPADVVTVGSSGGTINFSATASSTQGWLTVSPGGGATGTATAALTVGVSQAVLSTLAIGTYPGTITITPANGDNYSLPIAVTLTVGAGSTLIAAPTQLVFSDEGGQAQPAAQTVQLLAAGPNVGFTISTTVGGAANCGTGNWLNAVAAQTPLTTPDTVIVSVNTSGMTAGTCFGTVRLGYTGASGATETDVQVTLFVSAPGTPLLTVSLPQQFGYDVTTLQTNPGAGLIQHQLAIGTTDGSVLQYSVNYSSAPCAWLSAGPTTGGTTGNSPTPILVQILPGCITTPGNYIGAITISSPGLPSPAVFNLVLSVTSNVQIAVTPQSLTFNQSQGGPAPPAQNLNFTVSGGNAAFVASASSDLGWLAVTPASGNTSAGSVSVSVNTNSLPQQKYNGVININFQNAATPTASIPVQLIVGPAQALMVSPASLTFGYQLSGAAPAAEQLTLTSTGGSVNFTVASSSSGGWLGATPATGSTGSSGSTMVNVTVNPANIPTSAAAGQALTGTVTVTAPGVLANPVTVQVTLNITSAPAPVPATISTSAVNGGYGPIAPGELITIKGTNLGPATGTVFSVGTNGTVSSTLSGVQVLFDGNPGTPTYVSATQVNVIVPWEIAGRTSTNMVVSYNNSAAAGINLQVVGVAPGIYTQNATGSGQTAAVNLSPSAQSVFNGPAGQFYPGTTTAMAPAPSGSAIALYLTGGGVTSPASVTGSINPSAAVPLANWSPGSSTVTATIAGQTATVLYAGAAPTLITGVVQINLQIPSGVHGPALPVVITIYGVTTQTTATVAVQ